MAGSQQGRYARDGQQKDAYIGTLRHEHEPVELAGGGSSHTPAHDSAAFGRRFRLRAISVVQSARTEPQTREGVMVAKKRTSSRKKRTRRRRSGADFPRLLAYEYLLEILFANEFANMPREYAGRMAESIALAQGHPLENHKQFRRVVHIFLSNALDRTNAIRARVTESGETKQ